MSVFDWIKLNLKNPAKTVTEPRRTTHNKNRGANKFGLVPIGMCRFGCGEKEHVGTCVEMRLAEVEEEHAFRVAEESEWQESPEAFVELELASAHDGLPLRPSGPWNKKLECGHIVRDHCGCYRD